MITLRKTSVYSMAVMALTTLLFLSPVVIGRDTPPAKPAAPQKVTSIEGVTEYRLDNGLRILLYPDASTPKVSVICNVLVGSRHEGYGETGVAHILEHMNADHSGALRAYARAFTRATDAENATMTAIDRHGFEMTVTTPSGVGPARLAFDAPLTKPSRV